MAMSSIKAGLVTILEKFEIKSTANLDTYDFQLGDTFQSTAYFMKLRLRTE